MNIFETIGRVSSRREPYHSQFLADALEHSLKGDRSLFDGVWELAAPQDWETPDQATISAEQGAGTGRIDILIRSEHPHRRILGIEVKTDEASAHSGQLENYFEGLTGKYPDYDVQVSFLTPFNRERAGEAADLVKSIRIFKEFATEECRSRHISWLDVAEISWDDSPLWKQHQEYVPKHISSLAYLEALSKLNRGFAEFFGKEPAHHFLDRLSGLGVSGTRINLSQFSDGSSFAKSLADAFEILLDTPDVSRNARKDDQFTDELRLRFLDSPHRDVHEAMFRLSVQFPYVWVQGKRDYGVRTAHRRHSTGVSLLRSDGPEHLVVGEKR